MAVKMENPPYINTMASGNLSLLITEDVSWESFPGQAEQFVARFKGRALEQIDTPVERTWIVLLKGLPFWLTLEEFPLGMSLDSMSALGNPIICELHRALSAEAHGPALRPIDRENARSD